MTISLLTTNTQVSYRTIVHWFSSAMANMIIISGGRGGRGGGRGGYGGGGGGGYGGYGGYDGGYGDGYDSYGK